MTTGATVTNIYSTGFEPSEGFNPSLRLGSQGGWQSYGTGGNGLVSDWPGYGQQAFLGYSAPTQAGEDATFVWKPLNLAPVPAATPIVKFSVLMEIVDSDNDEWDNFQWAAYNTNTQILFVLDFDNYDNRISYALGTNFFDTGRTFTPNTRYHLQVTMDFASNRWSATLDDLPLVTDKPIAGSGVALNLGDVDAVWLIYDPARPGNNYLLFDNYTVTAEARTAPPRLELLGRNLGGPALLRIHGQDGSRYQVEASTNLRAPITWTALRQGIPVNGFFDVIDTGAAALPQRFYRARLMP